MTRFTMPAPTRDEIRRGIVYMIGAVVIFAAANALVKWQVALYPINEVVFFRSAFALIPLALLVAASGGLRRLRTNRVGAHVTRSFVQFTSMTCMFMAFSLLPLADAVAISFTTPLFMTLLSIPMLGERVGIHRWSAVVVGFGGVLVMVRPGAGVLEAGAMFAILNSVLVAVNTLAIRRMSVTEPTVTLMFYQLSIPAALSVLLLPLGWVTPGWIDLGMMAMIGFASAGGQYCWMQAFRFAPAAVAAPFSYSAMIWAMMIGYAVWGDVPTLTLIGGALVIAASGLYILYRETRRGISVTAPAATRAPAPGDD